MYIGAATQKVIASGSRPAFGGRIPHGLIIQRGDVDVGQLQDEPVAHLAGELQRQRAVRGDPDLELDAALHGNCSVAPLYSTGAAVRQLADDVDRLAQLLQRRRLAVGDAHRRVAAADAADGAVAVHLVERGEDGCRHRPVPGRRVRHERADHDPLGLGEDLAVDDVRLLPEQVRVERPHVAEAVRLGELGELHRARRRRVGLQDDSRNPSDLQSAQVLAQAALEEPAVALGAEVPAVVDDDLAAGEHRVDVAVDLEALPRGVVHVHVVGLARRPIEVCPFGS